MVADGGGDIFNLGLWREGKQKLKLVAKQRAEISSDDTFHYIKVTRRGKN